jgi:hypothetical protein
VFELVQFRKWPDRSGTKPPETNDREKLDTMIAVETLAIRVGARPTFLDNALWLACANMGLHMSNTELAALASEGQRNGPDAP